MLSLKDIKPGKKIILDNQPFLVLRAQHSKIGRMGAVLRTKLKNLKTGTVINKTFQGADKVAPAETESKKAQFLYRDGDVYYFMDNENYEQFALKEKILGESVKFLKEGVEVNLLIFGDEVINIELPIKMTFLVTEAPPAIKGNTADGGSKQVKIETGATVTVPLFIKEGDKIKINTSSGEYAERG